MKYGGDDSLPEVSEREFDELRQQGRPFTVLILKAGPNYKMPGPNGDPRVTALILQHGKRNMRLRMAGLLPIICRVGDGSGLTGVGVFDTTPEDVERIYADDPAVLAGVFTFEVHPCQSFPGSSLPRGDAAP